jgi:uncharacterized protein YbjT (DUF2867 family)/uncharacterized membrane protein YphA (DoxX/SURF4 family)
VRVLLTGANGFIGSAIAAAMEKAGHEVVRAVRRPRAGDPSQLACNMGRDKDAETWRPRLHGIDAVVNCAGILRQRIGESFQAVHVDAPLALFEACVRTGVRRVIQVSAIGDPQDAEFLASKHRCDAALARLDLDWTVLRPSVVYSVDGSYGGTSLLRAMACLPYVLFVPGRGNQQVQPVASPDLASAAARSLERPSTFRQVIEVAGPQVMSIRDYLLAWRRWFGFAPPKVIPVPRPLTSLACTLGEWLGAGPLGKTMQRMLDRDNVARPDALVRMESLAGVRPIPLERALAARPVQVQDRLHATTYFLFPLLLAGLCVVWLFSAFVGFLTPVDLIFKLFEDAGLPPAAGPPFVLAVSVLDAVLGLLILVPRIAHAVAWLMFLSVLGYTVLIGTIWPVFWIDPFGGLLKNLALLPALLLVIAWTRQR